MNNSDTFNIANLPIISQLMDIFGQIIEWIYNFLAAFDIRSAAWCIVVFTILTKLILLPSNISKYKRTRTVTLVNMENEHLSQQYNKKERKFFNGKMGFDKLLLDAKYGTSGGSGCLSFLLMFPIIIAMYNVIGHLDTYVPEIAQMNNEEILSLYTVFGCDIREKPDTSLLAIFPILYIVVQALDNIIISKLNGRKIDKSILASIFLTSYIAFRFASYLSLYWFVQTAFSFVISIIFTLYYNRKNKDYFIDKAMKKHNKSRKKRGLAPLNKPLDVPNVELPVKEV